MFCIKEKKGSGPRGKLGFPTSSPQFSLIVVGRHTKNIGGAAYSADGRPACACGLCANASGRSLCGHSLAKDLHIFSGWLFVIPATSPRSARRLDSSANFYLFPSRFGSIFYLRVFFSSSSRSFLLVLYLHISHHPLALPDRPSSHAGGKFLETRTKRETTFEMAVPRTTGVVLSSLRGSWKKQRQRQKAVCVIPCSPGNGVREDSNGMRDLL